MPKDKVGRLQFEEEVGVVPVRYMLGADYEETASLRAAYARAQSIVLSLGFVDAVEEAWFGGGAPKIATVFLFRFQSKDADVAYGWLVSGEIPWAFMAPHDDDSPRSVLARYVERAREWEEASGHEPADCMFGSYHPELRDSLLRRLQFIEQRLLPEMPLGAARPARPDPG